MHGCKNWGMYFIRFWSSEMKNRLLRKLRDVKWTFSFPKSAEVLGGRASKAQTDLHVKAQETQLTLVLSSHVSAAPKYIRPVNTREPNVQVVVIWALSTKSTCELSGLSQPAQTAWVEHRVGSRRGYRSVEDVRCRAAGAGHLLRPVGSRAAAGMPVVTSLPGLPRGTKRLLRHSPPLRADRHQLHPAPSTRRSPMPESKVRSRVLKPTPWSSLSSSDEICNS